MLKVFFGENRAAAEQAIRRELGEGYEVFEGENLTVGDLPSIFQGTSLFGGLDEGRRILLKNVSENAEVWGKLADYRETEYRVVVWEGKIDKRLAGTKALQEAGVAMQEFAAAGASFGATFGIFDMALRDGEKAVRKLEEIEDEQDVFLFFGLLVTQALKKYTASGGGMKERRILKELAKADLEMKSTGVEPWLIVKSFLLRVGKL